MRCPYCKKELQKGERKAYETLSDHVLYPNDEVDPNFLRPTFICGCKKAIDGFWDEMGDAYYEGNDRKIFSSQKNAIKVH